LAAFSAGRSGGRQSVTGIAGPTIISIGIAGHTGKPIVAANELRILDRPSRVGQTKLRP
jgi:hypothetical protein